MISVKRLRELLAGLPDDAMVYGDRLSDQEDGIGIETRQGKHARWWILANSGRQTDTYTDGFGEEFDA